MLARNQVFAQEVMPVSYSIVSQPHSESVVCIFSWLVCCSWQAWFLWIQNMSLSFSCICTQPAPWLSMECMPVYIWCVCENKETAIILWIRVVITVSSVILHLFEIEIRIWGPCLFLCICMYAEPARDPSSKFKYEDCAWFMLMHVRWALNSALYLRACVCGVRTRERREKLHPLNLRSKNLKFKKWGIAPMACSRGQPIIHHWIYACIYTCTDTCTDIFML